MKIYDFVKYTDFKKFYFLIYKDQIKNIDVLSFEIKDGLVEIDFTNPLAFGQFGDNWDIGKCIKLASYNANTIANVLDKTKAFEIDYLEHQDNIAYIHLNLKK